MSGRAESHISGRCVEVATAAGGEVWKENGSIVGARRASVVFEFTLIGGMSGGL